MYFVIHIFQRKIDSFPNSLRKSQGIHITSWHICTHKRITTVAQQWLCYFLNPIKVSHYKQEWSEFHANIIAENLGRSNFAKKVLILSGKSASQQTTDKHYFLHYPYFTPPNINYSVPPKDYISIFIHLHDTFLFSPLKVFKSPFTCSSASGWFLSSFLSYCLPGGCNYFVIILSVFYLPLSPLYNLRCVSSQYP